MNHPPIAHKLLILSRDFEVYNQIINQASLPGLMILATDDPGEGLHRYDECDIVFGEPSLVCMVINSLHWIKWVQSSWAGVEPLLGTDIRRDYVLTNVSNVYGPMISEYVFGYLLVIERRILLRWQTQQVRKWDQSAYGTLNNKVLGLMGVGSIGVHLAATAHHLGMRVYGYTYRSESCPYVDRYYHGDGLHQFSANLDYLVCTLPGTPLTKNLVGAKMLAALPRKAWLINIGRGSTVDEIALVEALNCGSLAGAVLDVFVDEPLPPNHPLWSTPNTILTSHTAARNYPPDIAAIFIDNYQRYIEGKKLKYLVDYDLQY